MNIDAVIIALALGVAVVAGPVIMLTLLALLGDRGRHRAGGDQPESDDSPEPIAEPEPESDDSPSGGVDAPPEPESDDSPETGDDDD